MHFHFDPPFQFVQTFVLALVLAGAAFWMLLHRKNPSRIPSRRMLLFLRGAVALLLLGILLNPTVTLPALQKPEKPPFLILLDTSRSMNTPDAGEEGNEKGATRWQSAKKQILENRGLLEALSAHYRLQFYDFNAHAQPQTEDDLNKLIKPDGSSTGLGEAITQVTNTNMPSTGKDPMPPGGMLLVSDGRDNGPTYPLDAATTARTLGLPIYTFCVGKETKHQDIQIVARRQQAFTEPGQTLDMAAEIRNQGFAHANVRVDLLKEGKRVASREVELTPGKQDISFPVTEARKGFYRYTFACSLVPGETDATNNRANVFLNVLDTRARVLLLEGRPSWDAKFLAQALQNDPTITLDSIFLVKPDAPYTEIGDPHESTIKLPRTIEEFARYDVVILGKGYDAFFNADSTQALKKWVGERGGNLVFLRGRADEHAQELRDLEPVTFGDAEIEATRAHLTEAGRSYPGFVLDTKEDAQTVVQKLPSLISAAKVQGEKALAVVLARAGQADSNAPDTDANTKEMALLAYQRYGQGKTLAIIGQGLWRWAFLPPELAQYGRVYDEFWSQTIRWLVSESDFLPGQNIALHTDHTSYSTQETVNFLGYLRGPKPPTPPTITVTQPDGKTVQIVASQGDGKAADFAAAFHPAQPGEYTAFVPAPPGSDKKVPATASFTVYPGQAEDANRSADPVLMNRIAEASGGQALNPEELAALPEKLHAAEQAATRTAEPRTAWDRSWVLALLLTLLTSEWLLRRRQGLI